MELREILIEYSALKSEHFEKVCKFINHFLVKDFMSGRVKTSAFNHSNLDFSIKGSIPKFLSKVSTSEPLLKML